MVDVDMSSTPLKVIGKEVCLQTKGLFRLLKDPRPKRCPNTLWREESKEITDSMKVEDGGVHHKRYDEHCTKQWVKIPKAIWPSPILGKRSTSQTSSFRVFWMKDDVKVKVPNRTPRILVHLDGVVTRMGCWSLVVG